MRKSINLIQVILVIITILMAIIGGCEIEKMKVRSNDEIDNIYEKLDSLHTKVEELDLLVYFIKKLAYESESLVDGSIQDMHQTRKKWRTFFNSVDEVLISTQDEISRLRENIQQNGSQLGDELEISETQLDSALRKLQSIRVPPGNREIYQ